jgi:hypothetical protein
MQCASRSVLPETLETIGRQRCVSRRVLDIAVPQIGLQRAGIVTVIGELIAAGVPQHVGMGLDADVGSDGRNQTTSGTSLEFGFCTGIATGWEVGRKRADNAGKASTIDTLVKNTLLP